MRLSIVIPLLDEAPLVTGALERLSALRQGGHEVICVDGGSMDPTPMLCEPLADVVLHGSRGRAAQMNTGARAASGDVLMFLHVDSRLPPAADRLVADALEQGGAQWGCFDVALSGTAPLLRLVEKGMNLRSRITGIATGDKAMFVTPEAFVAVGGFPDIALMEDIEMSRRLKRTGRPAHIRQRVVSSSRYWERCGIVHAIVRMWTLRLGYFLGADPRHLARIYYGGPE